MWLAGISSLFEGDNSDAPSCSNLARLFHFVDSDGDGYIIGSLFLNCLYRING